MGTANTRTKHQPGSVQKWRTSKEANHAWASLKRRKARRGNPEAAALKRWSLVPQRAEGRMLLSQRVQPKNWSPSLYTCQMRPIVLEHTKNM